MSALDEYREAKSSYLKLRNQAKKELVSRFNELASELFQIQRELLEDFGAKVAIPSKPKKTRTAKRERALPKRAPETPAIPPSARVIGLQKQIEKHKKRLSEAQAAGKPVKAIEDRLYELEDELRLAQTK